ncbi:MAG: zinc ribbon domain-containing protein [Deltaproteobacteria bacterium]|nr:zinc ribbon domain-containing protein [Deltaproteobacteria bacterium]
MAIETVEKISLGVTPIWKAIYSVTIAGCFLMAIGGFQALSMAQSATQLGMSALAILFFGGGGLMVLRIITRPPGQIAVKPEGLLIQSYFTAGIAEWENLEHVGSITVFGMPYLGIRLKDVERYITSREQLPDRTVIREVALVSFSARVLFTMAKIPLVKNGLEIILSLMGYSRLPESLREADLMEYNRKNFGYQIIFPSFLLTQKPAQVAERLQKVLDEVHRGIQLRSKEMTSSATPLRTDEKECPMCAEIIKAKAKVCRFCGHRFADNAGP